MIKAIEKELVSIVEEEVKIEVKLHQALIGAGGKRVKELQVSFAFWIFLKTTFTTHGGFELIQTTFFWKN